MGYRVCLSLEAFRLVEPPYIMPGSRRVRVGWLHPKFWIVRHFVFTGSGRGRAEKLLSRVIMVACASLYVEASVPCDEKKSIQNEETRRIRR